MSRIGKIPVHIPAGVTVTISGSTVSVKGAKGELSKTFDGSVVKITEETTSAGKVVHVVPVGNSRFAGAMHGTVRAIINNMVKGVVEGYKKQLEIQGVGFRAALSGNKLDLALGHSHPIIYTVPAGIKIDIKDGVKIDVSGADKHLVGQVAADIKAYKPVEPYKGKGVRIVGEYVRRKEGKKTA